MKNAFFIKNLLIFIFGILLSARINYVSKQHFYLSMGSIIATILEIPTVEKHPNQLSALPIHHGLK